MRPALVAVAALTVAGATFHHDSLTGSAIGLEYLVYVTSESADRISLIRFGPDGARIDHEIPTGLMPVDIDGPHGLAVSPDKRFYYVSLAHGQPNGSVLKYSTGDDVVVGRVRLGMFPATMATTPDGDFLYVVNFNLHGDMVPSSVSVVATADMVEVARIATCTMPHGSRVNASGTRQYSVCMMDDRLVEIDTSRLRIARQFVLTPGKEASIGASGSPPDHSHAAGGCSPTWAQPSVDEQRVYVACNGSNDLVEIDAARWTMVKRIPAGNGVYNLAVTPDGRLIATNKRGQSVSIFDLSDGRELARLPTRRQVVHGVVVSPDQRYAFVSVEGIGAEPGTVEVIDVAALKTVATVDVASQAAGIDFYTARPVR